MSTDPRFTAGTEGLVPKADAARQAVDALRGYVYQVTAAALAWLDLGEHARIFLEVAEDYATVADGALNAVQVKDTQASGNVTLNTDSVREAITNFIALVQANPQFDVHLEYFTTSGIGKERPSLDFPSGAPGLHYWRTAARFDDLAPLRKVLTRNSFPENVRKYVEDRDDETLRSELLRKIRWNCGTPDLASLRAEFRDRLVVIGRERFQVPATEIQKVSDSLLYRVLEKSLGKTPCERVLTRGDLISTFDETTRLSVPRALLEKLSARTIGLGHGEQNGFTPLAMPPQWLADSDALPKAPRLLDRPLVAVEIEKKLRAFGACFISGPSGVGKTHLARSVAEKMGGRFVTVDFRNVDAAEAKGRLAILLSHVGGLHARTLLLEDLNCIDDPQVAPALAQVLEALRRRDMSIITTCYSPPANRALTSVGLMPGCALACPYFSEEEASELVRLHEGDAARWGKLAYISAASGHPQLVHAFIAGVAARGWPRSEYAQILDAGLSSGDVEAERDAARRTIASALPVGARSLLYRLSLLIGNFDRTLALHLADVPPAVDRPGENLDALIGPWIEVMDKQRYRVSPLAAKFGSEMLVPLLRTQIHGAIASKLMSAAGVNVSDIDKIIMHAILGKNEPVLTGIAISLTTGDTENIEYLAQSLSVIRVLSTDQPLYPDNLTLSGMLRLVQFKIIAAGKEKERIAPCVHALLSEVDLQPPGMPREMFRFVSLGTVLNTIGIANYLDDWFELLQGYRGLISKLPIAAQLISDTGQAKLDGEGSVSSHFAMGSSGLSTINKLESIFEKLDKVTADDKALYLRTLAEATADFSVLVNSPWLAEQRNAFDHAAAAESYRRMAALTAPWGVRSLTLQCWIARTIMFDEYGKDRDSALRTLDEAESAMGEDVLLSRARAKVYWRAQDHVRALSILRSIADVVGQGNHIERAYALREAAISAAKTGDWKQAEAWFLEARNSAQQAHIDSMKIKGIGLEADAAVAALIAGRREKALKLVGDALTKIEDIDPKASLQAAYCHHVLRHIVLWFMSQIEGTHFKVAGEPISIEPGACSNMEPDASFAERPLGSIDIAWYMLAQMDVASRTGLGYDGKIRLRMGGQTIPPKEFGLQTNLLMRCIQDLDPKAFASKAWDFAACGAGNFNYMRRIGTNFNAREPQRETIPPLDLSPLSADVKGLIENACLAFAIGCACKHSAERIPLMQSAMTDRFGLEVVSQTVLALMDERTNSSKPSTFEEQLTRCLLVFRTGYHPLPPEYCVAAVQSLQQADRSPMKRELISMIAAWQREAWTRILVSETFRLAQPRLSVPAIASVLSQPEDDERFLCSLVLAICDATNVNLPQGIRTNHLQRAGHLIGS